MNNLIRNVLGGVAGGPRDPYFNYTTLLLPGTGTNGAQNGRTGPAAGYRDGTFLDSSSNNFTITRNGNTTQGTFSPFSQTGWGNYFDGTNAYLTSSHPALNATFTIEAWVYRTSGSALQSVVFLNGGGVSGVIVYIDTSNYLVCTDGSTGQPAFSNLTVPINTWAHIAVVRSGGTTTGYVNGTVAGSHTFTPAAVNAATIARYATANPIYFPGYISNVRVVNGTAVYTGAFTPPTSPLTAISGTSLLTCQSNRFIDNSTNNFTITPNGNTSVVPFSPFNPTASWSAATYGGSGYFDGSGDYLTVPDNAAFTLGNSDFCIELWINSSPSMGSYAGFFGQWANATTNCAYTFRTQASQIVQFAYTTNGNAQTGTSVNGLALTANSWNHLVVCRNGANLAIFQNGTRTATHNISTLTISDSTRDMQIGFNTDGSSVLGYMSNLRLVKGSSVYDPTQTSITVPTAPLTAITNTSLLLNFTNAGIYDATSKNDLETVGNAQISTTQSKWGGSSMYFDGTGDWLDSLASNQLFNLSSGNWTIEAWIYRNVSGAAHTILNLYNTAGSNSGLTFYVNASNQLVTDNGVTAALAAGTVASGQWVYVAIVRSGSTTTGYINGSSVGTTAQAPSASQYARVGALASGYYTFNGYIQDLRITRGYARYTANFTVPSTPFPLR